MWQNARAQMLAVLTLQRGKTVKCKRALITRLMCFVDGFDENAMCDTLLISQNCDRSISSKRYTNRIKLTLHY